MTEKNKTQWTNVSIPLGNIDMARERKAAYQSAAFDKGMKFSQWAREVLDKAAKFDEKSIPN